MKRLLSSLLLVLLAACQSAPAGFSPAPLTFSGPPIRVNVAEIRMVDDYHPPMQAPNIDHAFPLPPAAAVKQWAKQRLQAVGTQGVLEISVDDASVKVAPLPKTGGIKGLFTNDQDVRYDARIHATMRLYSSANVISVADGDIEVLRAQSVAENTTLDDRSRLFDRMTHEMLAKFDEQATARLRQYFGAYVR